MNERKFTPPTEFPAEYVDGNGNKTVILGRGPHEEFPFIGYYANGCVSTWTELGKYCHGWQNKGDLHDIPKRITTWHNVYGNWIGSQCSSRSEADDTSLEDCLTDPRLCVYRIERDEDGGNFEMFKEEV